MRIRWSGAILKKNCLLPTTRTRLISRSSFARLLMVLLRMPFQWRNFCAVFPNKSDKYMAFCIRLVNTLAIVSSSIDDDFHLATPQIANYIDFLPSQNRVSRNWTSGQCFYTKLHSAMRWTFFSLFYSSIHILFTLIHQSSRILFHEHIHTQRFARARTSYDKL